MTTLKDAARKLGVPYLTLVGWVNKAGLPTTRMGHYRLISLDVAAQLVASKRKA